jgi:hypothetical protein
MSEHPQDAAQEWMGQYSDVHPRRATQDTDTHSDGCPCGVDPATVPASFHTHPACPHVPEDRIDPDACTCIKRGRPREEHLDGCRIVGKWTDAEGDPARYSRTGTHYYGDGCPEHPALAEGRPVLSGDPIVVPRRDRPVSPLVRITREIWEERRRAEEKFPGQHLPDGTGLEGDALAADLMKIRCKQRNADGTLTWRDVLSEEFFEALAEEESAKLRAELIQVANVAIRWVEDIDRGAERGHYIPPEPEAHRLAQAALGDPAIGMPPLDRDPAAKLLGIVAEPEDH